MAKKKITAAVKTIATVGKGITATIKTVTTVETVAVVANTSKIFRKKAIIEARKETATMAARISKRSGAASFNGKEKYI